LLSNTINYVDLLKLYLIMIIQLLFITIPNQILTLDIITVNMYIMPIRFVDMI